MRLRLLEPECLRSGPLKSGTHCGSTPRISGIGPFGVSEHCTMGKFRGQSYEAKVAAELRQLTDATRKLREELRGMLVPKTERDPLRAVARGEPLPGERRRKDMKVTTDRRKPKKTRS